MAASSARLFSTVRISISNKSKRAWRGITKTTRTSRRRQIVTCMRALKTKRGTRAADYGLMLIRLSRASFGEMNASGRGGKQFARDLSAVRREIFIELEP